MVSVYEAIHAWVDQLSEEEAIRFYQQIQNDDVVVTPPSISLEKWSEGAIQLGDELKARYGEREVPSSVDLLHEAYEERLNDLMGSH